MRNATTKSTRSRSSNWIYLAATVILTASMAPGTRAGELGRCASAKLPWPIILPDETNQPAGSLTVCMERKFTGVSALHELKFDGYPIGLFMSRIGTAEGPAGDSVVLVFERNSLNEHRLIGYTVPDGSTLRTYALYDPKALRRQGKSGQVAALNLLDESSVWLAAGGAQQKR